jgi:hypothetical protein
MILPTSFGGELAVAFTIFLVDVLFEGEHSVGGVKASRAWTIRRIAAGSKISSLARFASS